MERRTHYPVRLRRVDHGTSPVTGITVSTRPASVAGVATSEGKPLAGVDGRYRFDGLAPGTYRILSSFDFDPDDPRPMNAAAVIELKEGIKSHTLLNEYCLDAVTVKTDMRVGLVFMLAVGTWSCGHSSSTGAAGPSAAKPAHVRITQFYGESKLIPRGLKGNICYGVENAVKVELTPPVETVWPSAVRCFEVAPTVNTTYTLTAHGQDGSLETKTIEQRVGAAPPKIYDLWVNSIDVARGSEVKICFKADNARSVKVSRGKLDATGRCMTDRPSKTTTYKITALGGDREMDTGTVNVKVH